MTKKVIAGIAWIISSAIYLLIAAGIIVALLPMVAGFRPVVVLSGSMLPTYPVGSVIYYKASAYEDIAVGDAITFKIGGGALATHRVIEKDDTKMEFTTKGDNNPTEDTNPIEYTNVVGKTAKIVIPYAGTMATYLKDIPVIIMLGAVLIICSMLTSKDKQSKDKTFRKDGQNEEVEQSEKTKGIEIIHEGESTILEQKILHRMERES